MQPLANRHEDRARRIAMNRKERGTDGDPAFSVGTAALAYSDFVGLASRIPEDKRGELEEAMKGIDAGFAGGTRSLAEHPDGSGRTMEGIGVINPLVVPAVVLAVDETASSADHEAAAGWGETAPMTAGGEADTSDFDPEKGNLNGQALTEQVGEVTNSGGAWGTAPATGPVRADPLAEQSGNGGGSKTKAKADAPKADETK